MSATTATALQGFLPYPVDFNARRTASASPAPQFKVKQGDRSASAKDPLIYEVHRQLDQVERLGNNWDDQGSLSPDPIATVNARQFVEDLFRQTVASAEFQTQDQVQTYWQRPHISANEDGEIVFEWWNADRKLTVYIGRDQLHYIKSWGPDVMNEMEDGALPEDKMPLLWEWLFE